MDEAMSVGIEQEIIAELTTEFKKEPWFDAEILAIKVRDAYRKVKSRIGFENTSYSEKKIENELRCKYFQDIKDVARYNISIMGADFQTSHSENGVSRTWRTEDEVLGNISAYVKFL